MCCDLGTTPGSCPCVRETLPIADVAAAPTGPIAEPRTASGRRSRKSWNEKRRKRYAEDEEYRKRTLARGHAYYQAHKQEIAAQHRQRYATDSEYRAQRREWNAYRRSAQIKRCYGISPEQYEALLTRQGGACAICRKRSDETLVVDHCHRTGEVRGLLCRSCNLALGHFKDDRILMAAAIAYLARAALDGAEEFAPSRSNMELKMATDDGPPDGGPMYRLMRQALVVALHRHLESDDGRRNQKLRLIADKLVDKAVEGDMQAIKELLDRVDGKPGASTTADEGPRKVTFEWKNYQYPWTTSPDDSSSPSTPDGSASPAS
jgi:Recombination endonuclease VII